MPQKAQLLLALAVLLPSCASTQRNLESSGVIGASSSPSVTRTDEPVTPPSAPPALNQALCDEVSATSVAAYEALLVTTELALGDECGPELGATRVWRALSVLVHDQRTEILWDLATRASAPESRAAAVIGLAKLRTISYVEAGDLLRDMPGSVTICKGTTIERRRLEFAAEFLPHRLDGESNELAMP